MAKFLRLKNGDLINHECVDRLHSEIDFGGRVYTLYYCHGLKEKISKEEFENFQKQLLSNSLNWKQIQKIDKCIQEVEKDLLNRGCWDGIRDWNFYQEVEKKLN